MAPKEHEFACVEGPAGTEGAEVAFDFPALEGHFVRAGGEIVAWCAWLDHMVPSMTAGFEADIEFGFAHVYVMEVGIGGVTFDCMCEALV